MLIRPKTICPALMLAANRNESVNGRTIILVVSIKIRNGFSHLGAPSGSKWAKEAFTVFLYEDRINDSQIGRPNVSVKIRWLDRLKVYGIKPIKLIAIININRFEIIEFIPFSFIVNVRVTCSFIIEMISDIFSAFDPYRFTSLNKSTIILLISNIALVTIIQLSF